MVLALWSYFEQQNHNDVLFRLLWETQIMQWHYKSADCEGLRDYLSTFPGYATCFSNKNVSEAGDDITELIQCAILVYIPRIYKTCRRNRKRWFPKQCNWTRKCKIETHKNLLQNPTLLANEGTKPIKKTVIEAKENLTSTCDTILSGPDGT